MLDRDHKKAFRSGQCSNSYFDIIAITFSLFVPVPDLGASPLWTAATVHAHTRQSAAAASVIPTLECV